MRKKLCSLLMAGAMICSLTACSGTSKETTEASSAAVETQAEESTETTAVSDSEETTEGATDGTAFKIGVLQLTQHAALDAANQGFIAALNDSGISYVVDQQNASGEQANCITIAEKFVNDRNDLILAIATPAAQAAAGLTSEIPILVTAVTDPAQAGLVDSNEIPGGNISGTSDLTPVKEQIELLNQLLPDAANVGILFCSAESNSEIQAAMAREALDELGIAHTDYTVSSSNEIQQVVESMIGKVDAIYAPTDNMIAAGMATVGMVANDNGIPVICGEIGMVSQGGLATYGIDYYQLGYMTGEQAVAILRDGADTASMPIGYLSVKRCELTINDETAELLGIDTSAAKQ